MILKQAFKIPFIDETDIMYGLIRINKFAFN